VTYTRERLIREYIRYAAPYHADLLYPPYITSEARLWYSGQPNLTDYVTATLTFRQIKHSSRYSWRIAWLSINYNTKTDLTLQLTSTACDQAVLSTWFRSSIVLSTGAANWGPKRPFSIK